LIPLLVGMGLRTFSQSPATVLRSKNLIRKLKASDCEALWKKAKTCGTAQAIQQLCLEFKKSLA
jgi:phosphoenolpyruvate-protein kinase (PTS system EI component)